MRKECFLLLGDDFLDLLVDLLLVLNFRDNRFTIFDLLSSLSNELLEIFLLLNVEFNDFGGNVLLSNNLDVLNSSGLNEFLGGGDSSLEFFVLFNNLGDCWVLLVEFLLGLEDLGLLDNLISVLFNDRLELSDLLLGLDESLSFILKFGFDLLDLFFVGGDFLLCLLDFLLSSLGDRCGDFLEVLIIILINSAGFLSGKLCDGLLMFGDHLLNEILLIGKSSGDLGLGFVLELKDFSFLLLKVNLLLKNALLVLRGLLLELVLEDFFFDVIVRVLVSVLVGELGLLASFVLLILLLSFVGLISLHINVSLFLADFSLESCTLSEESCSLNWILRSGSKST
jgi:hypothetical protein